MGEAHQQLIDRALAWAAGDDNIRRLVLVGSRAGGGPPDDLADVDLQVYAERGRTFTDSEDWLAAIGDTWLCIHDEYVEGGVLIPTRLVIADPGVKVDFSFYPAGPLSAVTAQLPHDVLIEKGVRGGAASVEPLPSRAGAAVPGATPTEADFLEAVREYWFERYHVAKYRARQQPALVFEREAAVRHWEARMRERHRPEFDYPVLLEARMSALIDAIERRGGSTRMGL